MFILVYKTVWNFIVCQGKFNRFINPNQYPEKIFWYLVRYLSERWLELSIFLLNKYFSKLMISKMLWVLSCSDTKIIFWRIIWSCDHKVWFWNWKCPGFYITFSQIILKDVKKIFQDFQLSGEIYWILHENWYSDLVLPYHILVPHIFLEYKCHLVCHRSTWYHPLHFHQFDSIL